MRKWVTLLAMADLDDKPHELIVTALVRGKMCELAAESRPAREREEYFTVGMFSVVDALLDSPMDVVLSSLPLSDEIKEALRRHVGPKGVVLRRGPQLRARPLRGPAGARAAGRVRAGDLPVGDHLGARGEHGARGRQRGDGLKV